jgi:hypothetical protein
LASQSFFSWAEPALSSSFRAVTVDFAVAFFALGFSGAVAALGLLAAKSLLHRLQNSGQVCPLVFPAALRSSHCLLHVSMAGVAAKEGKVIETASKTVGKVRITDFTLIASSWSGASY